MTEVTLKGGPGIDTLDFLIDGQRPDWVESVSIQAGGGDLPRVVIEVNWVEFDVLVRGDVGVPADIAQTLKQLGWTPPSETNGE